MANIPEQPAGWPDIRMIETTDRVLGGVNGPANAPLIAMLQRLKYIREAAETAHAAAQAAHAIATNAATTASAAAGSAQTAITNAAAAATTGGAAATAAQAALDAASAAATLATNAATTASAAQSAASSAGTSASTALTTAQGRAVRFDLGSVTIAYTATLAIGAGARSLAIACPGAMPGDAVFVAATAAVPDGYAVGAAQCLVADVIRVCVVHPALALNASFSITLRVFALR